MSKGVEVIPEAREFDRLQRGVKRLKMNESFQILRGGSENLNGTI
jgi:hypothetical protein